jgi:hypothetical protein
MVWTIRRPALMLAVPAVLAAELAVSGLFSFRPPPFTGVPPLLQGSLHPGIELSAYTTASATQRALRSGPARTVTLGTGGWIRLRADPTSTLFEVPEVQGYNPIQLSRYWQFVRALNPSPLPYNLSLFPDRPAPVVRDLLPVNMVAGPSWPFPEPSVGPVAGRGAALVFRAAATRPLASVPGAWTTASGPEQALREVTAPGFDPEVLVVVEAPPGIPSGPSAAGGTAVLRSLGAQKARFDVTSRSPSLVLIRIPFAPGWHATVDGREGRVVRADFLMQAVPVPAGRHSVVLTFDDPWIGYGLAGSAVVWAALLALMALARSASRSYREGRSPSPIPQEALDSPASGT